MIIEAYRLDTRVLKLRGRAIPYPEIISISRKNNGEGNSSAERGIFLRGSVLVLLVRRVVKNIWMAHAIIKPFFIKPYLYISVFKIAMV